MENTPPTPRICPVCDRTFDDKTYFEETGRELFFHHAEHTACVMENGEPIATMELSIHGVVRKRDYF